VDEQRLYKTLKYKADYRALSHPLTAEYMGEVFFHLIRNFNSLPNPTVIGSSAGRSDMSVINT